MGLLNNILNGETGLSARQKLNILMAFYNSIAKSDTTYNLERLEAAFVKSNAPVGKYLRDDGTWQTVSAGGVTSFNSRAGGVLPVAGDYTKADVGLNNVDNTSDAAKPVSTAQAVAISTKEPVIAGGTLLDFWRGDKTWANLRSAIYGSLINISGGYVKAAGVIANGDSLTLIVQKLDGNIDLKQNKLGIQKGVLFSDHFQRASLGANYTKVGSQTCTITGNELVISGGASSGTFAEVLKHTGYGNTNVNQFSTKIYYKIVSLTASTDFLGVGISSNFTAGQKFGVYAGMFQTTGSQKGQLTIYQLNGTSPGNLAVSSTNLAFSINDLICVELIRERYSYTAKVYNVTTNSAVITVSYSPSTYVVNQLANTGNFALMTYSGSQTLSSWVTTSTDKQFADMCFIGDSITEIFAVNNYDNNYTEQVAKKSGNSVVKFGRVNAVTQDILNSLPEIISFAPKRVYVMVGGNDINFSIATGVWQANLTAIWNGLIAAGIPFTNLLATPRNNGSGIYNIVPVNNYMISSGHAYIDTYTALAVGITANPKYFDADGVHPNDIGHDFIASIILNQL